MIATPFGESFYADQGDRLDFHARVVKTATTAGRVIITWIDLKSGEVRQNAINVSAPSLLNWTKEAIGTFTFPGKGLVIQIGGAPFKGGATNPALTYFGMELFSVQDGNSERFCWGAYSRGGIGGFWPGRSEDPFSRPKRFTFQGAVTNGAGGAGNQTYTLVADTGGWCEVVGYSITNNDTVNRTVGVAMNDGGGRIIYEPTTGVSIAAGIQVSGPHANALAAGSTPGTQQTLWVGGSDQLVATALAVAASQDTAASFVLNVYGGTPTVTLAGASTPTLTTNTSRFED